MVRFFIAAVAHVDEHRLAGTVEPVLGLHRGVRVEGIAQAECECGAVGTDFRVASQVGTDAVAPVRKAVAEQTTAIFLVVDVVGAHDALKARAELVGGECRQTPPLRVAQIAADRVRRHAGRLLLADADLALHRPVATDEVAIDFEQVDGGVSKTEWLEGDQVSGSIGGAEICALAVQTSEAEALVLAARIVHAVGQHRGLLSGRPLACVHVGQHALDDPFAARDFHAGAGVGKGQGEVEQQVVGDEFVLRGRHVFVARPVGNLTRDQARLQIAQRDRHAGFVQMPKEPKKTKVVLKLLKKTS